MKKIFFLHLAVLFTPCFSFSQEQELVDSLETALKQHNEQKQNLKLSSPTDFDTVAADILCYLSQAYWQGDLDKSIDYGNQALLLSEEIGFRKGIGKAINSIAVAKYYKGDYLPALELQKKAMRIWEEIGSNKGLSLAYNNLGLIYTDLGNYPEALKNHLASLKIAEKDGDTYGQSLSFNNIGNVYSELQNFTEALKNHQASLKLEKALGSKFGIASSYTNIGLVYYNLDRLEEALKSYNTALNLCEEIGDKNGIATANYNIGVINSGNNNFSAALKNFFITLGICEEYGIKIGIAQACHGIGDVYLKQKNYSGASAYLSRALSTSTEIGSMTDTELIYESLSQLDSAKGNFRGAFEYYKQYILVRDSLRNDENTRKITQQQMQYDFDKKEAEAKAEQDKKDALALKELQKQKLVRNGFVGGFAVVVLFAGVFFTQRNKIKKGKKISDELLLNILPSEVAEELKAKGSADAKQFDDVTVMFTDFKNFTQISEKLSPTDLVNEIHNCFKAFDNIIGKHNIEKIKTIGDSYMCAGGLPVANKTNATDVINAALEIIKFMEEHLQQRKNEGKEPFEIRIGIHTGPVVAGIVGVKKFAYDIWGDTVNIASRMESSGEAGKINISGSTYELVKDLPAGQAGKFNFTHRGKIEAKNKGEIDMYFVERSLGEV